MAELMPQLVILHLSLIPGVGAATIQKIISCKPAQVSWSDFYQYRVQDWVTLFGCTPRMGLSLVHGLANQHMLQQELTLLEHHAVNWITIFDHAYPDYLATIAVPPPVLYWQGDALAKGQNRLALVGSRQADTYAQAVVKLLVPELVQAGWVLVSGGAIGADSMVHAATIAAGGKTVVVLGSGLLQPYPATNQKLFEMVIEHGGTVLSGFSLRTQAFAGNFPARNRVIAGLSKGCVVLQAAQKSGALITAEYALAQGREVFAVPGAITNPLSAGCHKLIQQGAKTVTKTADILEEFGQQVAQAEKFSLSTTIKQERANSQDCFDGFEETLQEHIIKLCRNPCSMQELLEHTRISMQELSEVLFVLQIEGKIVQNFAGLWEKL